MSKKENGHIIWVLLVDNFHILQQELFTKSTNCVVLFKICTIATLGIQTVWHINFYLHQKWIFQSSQRGSQWISLPSSLFYLLGSTLHEPWSGYNLQHGQPVHGQRGTREPYFFNFCRTSALFVGPLIPLFWTSTGGVGVRNLSLASQHETVRPFW